MDGIPFSDYPAPADERSQIQTRLERKAELGARAQQAAGGGRDPQAERQTMDGIRQQMDANEREIDHLRHSLAARQKAEAENRLKKDAGRRRLDTTA